MTWLKIYKDQKKVSYTMRFPVEDFLFSACRYFCPKGSAALQNAFFMPKRNRWFLGAHYSLPTYMGRLVYFHLKGPTTTTSTKGGKNTMYIPFVIESTCRSRLFPFLMPNTGWLWWCRYIQVDKSTKTTLRICKKQQLEICLASPLNCYIQTIVIFKSRIECWVTFRVLYQDQWHCFPISETDPFE